MGVMLWMHLTSTGQALFPVVQGTDDLCHFGLIIFLCWFDISVLQTNQVFYSEFVFERLGSKEGTDVEPRIE
jgi:hypothetical protein